jgi:hypothetical protein
VVVKLIPQSLTNRLTGLTVLSKPFVRPVPLFLVSTLLSTAIVVLLFSNVVNHTGLLLWRAQDLAAVEQKPVLFLISMALLLVAVGAYLLVWRHDGEVSNPALRFAARFSVVILTLSLLWITTIAFNVHVRGLKFPIAMITDRQGKPEPGTCGLLVYSTSKILIFWDVRTLAGGPQGVISVHARSDDDRLLVLAERNVLDIAKQATSLSNLAPCSTSAP